MITDSERLRPEELNQQNIEGLVAESNMTMEILPVNDLNIALQDFVNKDDKLAFYSCLKNNLEETRNKLASESDKTKIEEEELILKVEKCMQEHVKERSLRPKETIQFTSSSQTIQDSRDKSVAEPTGAFSDDEEPTFLSSSSTGRGRKGTTRTTSTRDISGGVQSSASRRGKGRVPSGGLKQTTLDATMIRHSERSMAVSASTTVQTIADEENLDSASDPESERCETNEVVDNSEPEASPRGRGTKRRARGRGRGSTKSTKRGKKLETSILHNMFMNNDDDDDDEDGTPTKLKTAQPRTMRNYGSLLRKR